MTIETDIQNTPDLTQERRFGCLQVLLIVLVAIVATVLITLWVAKAYIFPSEFTPVTLSAKEEQILDSKLQNLDTLSAEEKPDESDPNAPLEPEPYTEAGAERDVALSEKELNALLARNTDLARKLAIDLSDDLVSAKLLVPVDEDFPILGGKTLKVKAGLEMAFDGGKPIVVLRGVSIMGVPIPNAWLGGIKNIDLVKEFGEQDGFWNAFAAGIEELQVEEGQLRITLKE